MNLFFSARDRAYYQKIVTISVLNFIEKSLIVLGIVGFDIISIYGKILSNLVFKVEGDKVLLRLLW